MGKNDTYISSSSGTMPDQRFLFPGTFDAGTWPTLLDAAEAQRVKAFIEALVFRCISRITTGNPSSNKFRFEWGSDGVTMSLDLQTALRHDLDPYLGGDLNLDQKNLVANGSGSVFKAFNDEGFTVASAAAGEPGAIRLNIENSQTTTGIAQGFKANNSGTSTIVWTLPDSDGTAGYHLKTDGNGQLGWEEGGGGGGIPNIDGGRPDTVYLVTQNANGGAPDSTY